MAREQCRLVFNSHERQGIETFIIRRPQILSVEIPGPKWELVLLSKFSLYRAVRAPVGVRALS